MKFYWFSSHGWNSETATAFKAYFSKATVEEPLPVDDVESASAPLPDSEATCEPGNIGDIFMGYASDLSDDIPESDKSDDESPPSKQKRQTLVIPAHMARKNARDARQVALREALMAIEKHIKSKKTIFAAGRNGMQAYHANAIQSYLWMVVHNGRKLIEASEIAAESQGFARKWGGRLVRQWARRWIERHELPVSQIGRHGKVFTLLDDPIVCAELRSFLQSNKWVMDPEKLAKFSKNNMVTKAAEEYLHHLVHTEMPHGLKKYLDLELFPRIQLKVGRGILLQTAHRWLHREGFRYTEHKKALHYDGHDRPGVVHYRQNIFLPAMAEYRKRFIEYAVGNVEQEVEKSRAPGERKLVLCAHDEMTSQANDGVKRSWVLEGEHALKKKGVGRGMHQSDVICSTFGWMEKASQSLEYGKNYEGYWTGELFVKQVCYLKVHYVGIFTDICLKAGGKNNSSI
jgi:hypothetical protein